MILKELMNLQSILPWAILVGGLILLMLLLRITSPKMLLVIGNGFDLYHGINSSYTNFRDYLQKKDPVVFKALEKYLSLQSDSQWNDFEANLSSLDGEELLDEMKIHLGDSEKASSYSDFQYEVGKITDNLGTRMKQQFLNWALQLDIRHTSGTPRLKLPPKARYLNFNYTGSLEKIYRIRLGNILFIHGKAVDESSEIVLGHGWHAYEKAMELGPPTYEDFANGGYPTEPDWQYDEAKSSVEGYFAKTYKNSNEIIRQNQCFFKRLRHVKKIYVMGHSMRPVDGNYFKEIAKYINTQNVQWIVSYHSQADITACTATLQECGINLNLVEFKKLSDFFSNQLSLF